MQQCSRSAYATSAGVGLRPQLAAGAAQPVERAACASALARHSVQHGLQGLLWQPQQRGMIHLSAHVVQHDQCDLARGGTVEADVSG